MMATSDLLLAARPDSVLGLGDLQYDRGTRDQFARSYHPTWGRIAERTRPVPGNHEYETAGAAGYFDYFLEHGAAGAAGDRDEGYYSFDLGNWHVVALDSNCLKVACDAGSRQERWLRDDLARHATSCTLAYMHHPLFSSGEHGGSDDVRPLWQALHDAGAEVVLAGHDHDYERFAPQDPDGRADATGGLREFVVGTGGAPLKAFVGVQPHSEARQADSHGVLTLTLHPDRYSWNFLPVAGAEYRDAGEASCHGAGDPRPVAEIDLVGYVADFARSVHPEASGTYAPPSTEEAHALDAGVRAAREGDMALAARSLEPIGYLARQVRDVATGDLLTLLEEPPGPDGRRPRGWGLYVLRPGSTSAKLLEVPHPLSEYAVEHLAVAAFQKDDAAALLVAGAHRGASAASDVAHRADSAFEVVHHALLAAGAPVVQIHGFDSDKHPDDGEIVVSSGIETPGPQAQELASALQEAGFRVCTYDGVHCTGLGTTENVQGVSSREAGAVFLQVEVARSVRDALDQREPVAEVLAAYAVSGTTSAG